MATKLDSIRCKHCGKLLALLWVDNGQIEIKCPRCKKPNQITFGPQPPKPGPKGKK